MTARTHGNFIVLSNGEISPLSHIILTLSQPVLALSILLMPSDTLGSDKYKLVEVIGLTQPVVCTQNEAEAGGG